MQNIKNFTKYTPSAESCQTEMGLNGNKYDYLISEDGLDWYECHSLFLDSTIKIMYDENSIIQAVVSMPVPERGNILAVSMFFPLNMSVTEVHGPLPVNFEMDTKTWLCDGKTVYQDVGLLTSRILSRNSKQQLKLMKEASAYGFAMQCSADIGNPRDGDNLKVLQRYVDSLRCIDLNNPEPTWPNKPDFLLI